MTITTARTAIAPSPRRHARQLTLLSALMTTSLLAVTASLPARASLSDALVNTPATPLDDYRAEQHWQPHHGNQLAIWQGFDHRWLRFVVVPDAGQVPHRISKLHNYLAPPSAQTPAQAHMAQSTGVDGNYMRPQTYYTQLDSTPYQVWHGATLMSWTDRLDAQQYPRANNRIRQPITPPAEALAGAANLILAGIELDLECRDSDQPASEPCNSHGIWPYLFRIDLTDCQGGALANGDCHLAVDIYRAWTPNKGGFQLPPIFTEVKPLNQRLRYQLRVRYTWLASATPDQATPDQATPPVNTVRQVANLHQRPQPMAIDTQAAGAYPAAVAALTGWGFYLSEPEQLDPHWQALGSDTGHRGRYLGHLQFQVSNAWRDTASGTLQWTQRQAVRAPLSVVNGQVETELSTLLLPVSLPAQAERAQGRLCINSSPQAPAFSRWQHCGQQHWLMQWLYGAEQAQDSVTLAPANVDRAP